MVKYGFMTPVQSRAVYQAPLKFTPQTTSLVAPHFVFYVRKLLEDQYGQQFANKGLSIYTTLIAVPLGVAFAIGIDRWRSRPAEAASFVMVFSFVIPELIFGVALFFVFNTLFTQVHLGTTAETLGLVTWNLSWPAIIVRARLVTIGRQYEEAAADLIDIVRTYLK